MAKSAASIDLDRLSSRIRQARERKGWTLEELSHTLWERGFPTSQNKLWRMENKPPRRLDTSLLLWLEKVLEVSLVDPDQHHQILKEDVLELIDLFVERKDGRLPKRPVKPGLAEIYDKMVRLIETS